MFLCLEDQIRVEKRVELRYRKKGIGMRYKSVRMMRLEHWDDEI